MAGDIVGKAYIEISPLTSRFQQQLTSSLQQVHAGGGFQVPVSANAQGFQQSIAQAIPRGGMLLPVHADTKALTDGITAALSKLARTGLMIAGIGSIFSMVISHLKGAIYEYNNQIQQARIGLETLLGSAQEADDLIEGLKVFARETPFQFKDLVTNTQTLIAMGTAAKDVIPTLTAVGDALSGLGRMSSMPRILFDLGQIRATGRLTGRELMNMSMQGIPVLKYLADATGRSMAELREQMAKGTRSTNGMMIDSATAIHAILTGMENQFGGLMKRQMSTAQGAISNWKDSEQQLLGAIGEPLFNKIISLTIGVSKVANDMSTAFSEAGKHGKSGLTAVREVFVNLFPESAQGTINSVLDNLGKNIHDIGEVMRTVVDTFKEWGAVIAGGVLIGLRGLLDVLRPINDFIAAHKVLVEDLVKVYLTMFVIGKITALWTAMTTVINGILTRMVAFTAATKLSTVAINENTAAVLRQRAASSIPMAGSLPSPGAAGLSRVPNQLPIPVGQAGAATRMQSLAASLMTVQAGALIAAGGMELFKTKLDQTGDAAKPVMTAFGGVQGALVGFAVAGPAGAAIGLLAGAFMGLKGAVDAANKALEKWKGLIATDATKYVTDFTNNLDLQFGTGADAMPAKIKATLKFRDDLQAAHNSLAPILEAAQAEGQTINNSPAFKDMFQHWQQMGDEIAGLDATLLGPDGQLGSFLKRSTEMLAAANGNPAALLKVPGITQEYVDAMFNPGHAQGSHGFVPSTVKSIQELYDEIRTSKDPQHLFDVLNSGSSVFNDLGITSVAQLKAMMDGTNKVAESMDELIKKAKAAVKTFQDQFAVEDLMASANETLHDTFKSLAEVVKSGSVATQDWIDAGKGLRGSLTASADAVYSTVMKATHDATAANIAMEQSQKDIIDSFINMAQAAGLPRGEIDKILESLGLLDLYKKVTIDIQANGDAFWTVFDAILNAIGAASSAWGAADLGGLASLAGASNPSNPFDAIYNKILGATPGHGSNAIPEPKGTKGSGSGKSAADSAAEAAKKAAADLESASHAFYETIVSAATAFQDHIKSFMGSPAERLQQTQSVGIGRMIRNTDMRTAAISDWSTGLAKLRQEGLSQMAIDQLGLAKGPEMDRQVKRLLRASPDEITKLNASLTSEQAAAAAAAWKEQGNTIAKAITDSLGKFFADSGLAPDGTTGISITNQFMGGVVDPDALALAIINKLGGKVKL